MGKSHEYKALTREELNALAGEELPERAAMSLINARRRAQRGERQLDRVRKRAAERRHHAEQLSCG